MIVINLNLNHHCQNRQRSTKWQQAEAIYSELAITENQRTPSMFGQTKEQGEESREDSGIPTVGCHVEEPQAVTHVLASY